MSHPIVLLQAGLVGALLADMELAAIVGGDGVFDAPPKGRAPPYIAIARHDVLARDGDLTPGHDHRLLIDAWASEPSRKAALAIAERVVVVALSCAVSGLVVTHRQHDRTDTAVDGRTGRARAAVALRFFTEPA